MLTPDQLAAIRDRLEDASPKWGNGRNALPFLANAWQDADALLAEVDRLRGLLTVARKTRANLVVALKACEQELTLYVRAHPEAVDTEMERARQIAEEALRALGESDAD